MVTMIGARQQASRVEPSRLNEWMQGQKVDVLLTMTAMFFSREQTSPHDVCPWLCLFRKHDMT